MKRLMLVLLVVALVTVWSIPAEAQAQDAPVVLVNDTDCDVRVTPMQGDRTLGTSVLVVRGDRKVMTAVRADNARPVAYAVRPFGVGCNWSAYRVERPRNLLDVRLVLTLRSDPAQTDLARALR